MIINGTVIEDTFAEAFGMSATRVIITAINHRWARIAGETMTGFATSVIGCGVEAGIEAEIAPDKTPDGRPGVSVLLFGMSG
ncbi:MAG: formylmethanofuran--tetrahydromethanopterin N-formyltransferase, partial [Candidatus Thiodiazotropha sp.]